jgi:hypothetical protein
MASPTLLTAMLPALWADGRSRSLGSFFKERLTVLDDLPEAQFAAIAGYTSTYDASDDIQKAIDEHVYGDNAAGAAVFPRGLYSLGKTIHGGYGVGFVCARLIGPGMGQNGTHGFNGATLTATFSNAPLISLQGGRSSVVEGFALLGGAKSYIQTNNHGALTPPAGIDDTVGANWVDPAILTASPNADGRYTPFAGVAIDPYGGTAPSPSYPTVAYPVSRVGSVAQYGKGASSRISVDRTYIAGFVVAVALQPADFDANGDFLLLDGVTVEACRYGLSVGNTQSRNVRVRDCNFNQVHTALTSKAHGKQNGRFGGLIDNLSCSKVIQIFDFGSLSIVGPLRFANLYVESGYRLGNIAPSSASETSLTFDDIQADLGGQGSARGVPANILNAANQAIPVSFNGGQITNYPTVAGIDLTSRDLTINGVNFKPSATPTQLYQKAAEHATCGGLILNQLGKVVGSRAPFRAKWQGWTLDTVSGGVATPSGASAGSIIAGPSYPSKRGLPTPIYMREHFPALGTPDDSFPVPPSVVALSKASSTATLVNDLLTITFSSRTDTAFMTQGPLPGDLIWDDQTGTVFKVASRSSLFTRAGG